MSIYKGKDGRKQKKVDFGSLEEQYQIKLQQERIRELSREIKKILTKLRKYTQRYSFEKLEKDFKPRTPEDYEAILVRVQGLLNRKSTVAQREKKKYLTRRNMQKDAGFLSDYSDEAYDPFYEKAYSNR